MKKNLLTLFSFIILILILTIFIGQIFIPRFQVGKYQGPYYITKGFEKIEKNTIDIIFLGSSNSYETMSPMEIWNDLGITSYDYGLPAARIYENYYFLKYLLTKQSPKVVFLDVTTCFYKEEQAEPMKRRSFDYLPFSKIKLEMINDPVFENTFEDKISILFPLLRYHDRWNKPNVYYYTEGYHPYNKGFVISGNYNPVDNIKKYMEKKDEKEVMNDTIEKYLGKIVELLKEKNIELVLTAFPNYKSWDNNKSKAIEEYAKEQEVRFFEMNHNDTGIDWKKDTGDKGIHTNILGSLKATKYMEKYIEENYQLEDKRNNKEYDSWNKDFIEYKKILDKAVKDVEYKFKNKKYDEIKEKDA